jgi:glutathione S-transferase
MDCRQLNIKRNEMMKLYYSPGACSLAPMILAEWLDIPLDLERTNIREKSPEFLAINPMGAVPALQLDNGLVLTQVDAILQYLSGLRPEAGFSGGDIMEEFRLNSGAAFLTGDFHPPFGGWFNPARYTTDHSDASLAATRDAMEQRILQVTAVLDEQVGDSDHIALDRRTFLDPYAFAMIRWLNNFDNKLEPFPNLKRFMSVMAEDQGVQAALAREQA